MMRFVQIISIFLVFLVLGCERAQRFPSPSARKTTTNDPKNGKDEPPPRLSWMEPEPRSGDLPIHFVADRDVEWRQLPGFWTHYPLIPPFLAQPPLAALTSLVWTEQVRAIKIKVPRGLPDPTPNFPPNNPPTYGKWRLGKELFHKPLLRAGDKTFSCASCHVPGTGFTQDERRPPDGRYNTLSLVNVAFNRRQFWDGRVRTLEETLFRSLADERNLTDTESRTLALEQHVWGGFVRALFESDDARLEYQFNLVFGVKHPTQDTVARALATYLRTILAGDSLYDRAERIRRDRKEPKLTEDHFRVLLTDGKAVDLLVEGLAIKARGETLPALVVAGHGLFHGKAKCSQCHAGPLFTDQDYHNIGYRGPEGWPGPGKETGRAVHVPIGLKESRFIGAFRTPSLRNLSRTAPYFHDGSHWLLKNVVEFYDAGVQPTAHLATALRDGERERQLQLTEAERTALVVFLRTLDGVPPDPIVTNK
jgi:cytochrome c peroxidase